MNRYTVRHPTTNVPMWGVFDETAQRTLAICMYEGDAKLIIAALESPKQTQATAVPSQQYTEDRTRPPPPQHSQESPPVVEDRPTRMFPDGTYHWLDSQGKLHRENGPAVVNKTTGVIEYYLHGKRHRDEKEGPAVTHENGLVQYYFQNQLHRTDGPAVVWPDGTEEWFFHDKRHRDGGPAITRSNGSKEWWIGGVYQQGTMPGQAS